MQNASLRKGARSPIRQEMARRRSVGLRGLPAPSAARGPLPPGPGGRPPLSSPGQGHAQHWALPGLQGSPGRHRREARPCPRQSRPQSCPQSPSTVSDPLSPPEAQPSSGNVCGLRLSDGCGRTRQAAGNSASRGHRRFPETINRTTPYPAKWRDASKLTLECSTRRRT